MFPNRREVIGWELKITSESTEIWKLKLKEFLNGKIQPHHAFIDHTNYYYE